MKDIYSILCLTAFIFFSFVVVAQTSRDRSFIINSFEGEQAKINIKSDYIHGELIIELDHYDSICINDYMGGSRYEKLKVINQKFILVSFSTRGGSGESPSSIFILSVLKGHLHIAFLGSSEDWSGGIENEIGNFRFEVISINSDSLNGYKLVARQYEKITSLNHPGKNYEAIDTLYFRFDEINKIFYNKRITLNGDYVLDSFSFDENMNFEKSVNFKSETYPTIEIKRHAYLCDSQTFTIGSDIFIKGKWYGYKGYRKNHLGLIGK